VVGLSTAHINVTAARSMYFMGENLPHLG
jgi:hypothetical protein